MLIKNTRRTSIIEVKEALKLGKAVDQEGISTKVWKYLCDKGTEHLTNLFNNI